MRWSEWVFKCDSCGNHICPEMELENEAQKYAESCGWEFGAMDFCDECSAKL